MSWIKMETSLRTHPKVVTLASRLSVTPVTVMGALCHSWMIADEHADATGLIPFLDLDGFDLLVELPGLGKAMVDVGWLEVSDGGIQFPNYLEHNGSTAKARAQSQRRQSKSRSTKKTSRKTVTDVTQERDKSVTREEKRREEVPTTTTTREDGQPCIDGFWTLPAAIAAGQNMMIPENVIKSWWLSRDGAGWADRNGHTMRQEGQGSNLKSYWNHWQSNEARDKANGKGKIEPIQKTANSQEILDSYESFKTPMPDSGAEPRQN